MDVIRLLDVREEPLSVDEVLAAVADRAAGGTCLFIGSVREVDGGRDVTSLDYEAHPSVGDVLRTVAEKVVADVPLRALAAVHRVGHLEIGDVAVVVAAAAEHRQEAFTACRQLIDDLKREVPIWKHQRFGDGDDEWARFPMIMFPRGVSATAREHDHGDGRIVACHHVRLRVTRAVSREDHRHR